jgi:ABC-type molybdate transport system substrate-binding protein
VQREIVYTAAVCVNAKEPQPAQAFIGYLLSLAAATVTEPMA